MEVSKQFGLISYNIGYFILIIIQLILIINTIVWLLYYRNIFCKCILCMLISYCISNLIYFYYMFTMEIELLVFE